MSEDRHPNGRLDSWKEIAAYLNRDVRTVIRWETKGLPVHRVPGGKRQAVFAYPAEIDAWLSGQNPNGNPSALSIEHPAGDFSDSTAGLPLMSEVGPVRTGDERPTPTGVRAFTRNPWKVGIATVSLLTVVWVTGAMLMPFHTSATVHPISLKQLTDDGRAKGNLRTDGENLYFNEAEGSRSVLASVPVQGGPIRHIHVPFSNLALQDVSKDGTTLLLTSYEGILIEGPLWAYPLRGGLPHRVGDAVCNVARWSPDNRMIACAHETSVIVMNADGSHPHTIGSFSIPVTQVTWTPDGGHLRYALDDRTAHVYSQWEIALGPDDTASQPHKLPFGPGCCLDWTWTHDKGLFFSTEQDDAGKTHLMVQTEAQRPPTEVPLDIGSVWPIVAGKKDNKLYLAIAGATRGELLKYDPVRRVFETMLPGVSASYVSFSPDGQWLTYTDPGGGSLWRSRADGSQALQLASASMQVEVSSWSPDGRTIAFMGRMPGKPFRIYLIDRDGGQMLEASAGEDNQGGPSWSPDGKGIVYGNVYCEPTQSCWIRTLDLRTRKTEILPGSNGLRTARWSPDGRYIAALRFQTHELMLFDIKTKRWRVLADSVAGDNVNWSRDSQYVYVDSPRDMKPIIERIRIKDAHRATVVTLDTLRNVPGTIDTWMGLAPDNSPIVSVMITSSELYALTWARR